MLRRTRSRVRRPLFPLGGIYATPGVIEAVGWGKVLTLLRRHVSGDWGELDSHDRAANNRALKTGGRIFSAYTVGEGDEAIRVWIITEADRSATTALLPEEY